MSDSAASGSLDLGALVPRGAASRESSHASPIDSKAFRRGDPKCFAKVLDRFGPSIRRVVNSYTDDRHDRDDLYQQVCMRLLIRRKHYREMGAMEGWITTLARGVCRNWRNAQIARESAVEGYSSHVPPVEESDALLDDPSRVLKFRTFLEQLDQAIAALPDRQATAWRLVHYEGYSTDQAARMMRTSPATVRSQIRHVRNQLRDVLEDAKNEFMP